MKTRPLLLKIENWLRQKNGDCFCNRCLAQEIGEADSKAVNRVVAHLSIGQGGVSRYRARCAGCGTSSLVVRVSPSFAWA
jgi:hypothetical protein